jgi:hypothetical protein
VLELRSNGNAFAVFHHSFTGVLGGGKEQVDRFWCLSPDCSSTFIVPFVSESVPRDEDTGGPR